MRSLGSLRFRIPALAMGTLAGSLVVAIVIAFELLLAAGRLDLDDVLQREQRRFERSITAIVQRQATRGTGEEDLLRAAVREYLRLTPDTEVYLTVVRIGDQVLTADRGPRALEPLRRARAIPTSTVGRLETVASPAGELRSLLTPVAVGDERVAQLQVIGPTAAIRTDALSALTDLAVAAAISLLLGGCMLFVVLRRALRPLHDLARAARSTEFEQFGERVPEPRRRDEVGSLAREFNLMLDRLKAASDDRTQFMAAVSHELRTPVTIMRGHVETLASIGAGDEEALAETAAVSREELSRMSRLVEDLMALARSEADGFISPAPFALPAFFDELRLRLTGLDVGAVDVVEPPDVWIEADAGRLAQALLNLVQNASIHTPEGTLIVLSAALQDGVAILRVDDDGPGIDRQLRERVFEPFVTSGSGRLAGSTGLGLAVVRAIVEGHGGSVELSTSEQGTTFLLRLPGAQIATPDGSAEASSSSAPTSGAHRGRSA